MEQIKDTISTLLRSWSEQKKGAQELDPEGLIKRVLTKKELQHIKFNYFSKGVVGLKVDSPAWAYSLNLRKKIILANLNEKSDAIKDLRLRIGDISGETKTGQRKIKRTL